MGVSEEVVIGAARSAFSGDSQHKRLIRLEFPFEDGPPAILLPNKLVVHEEVSRGFRIDIEVLSDEPRLPLKMLMGRMVTISLVRQDGSLRYFNGHITEFRFLRTDGGFAFYRMVLEPWLAFARLRKNCVSFHGKTVKQITEETLKHYRQADWHMHIFESDPPLTVANQHNETDYNHLHRRWEALGLHYWYEHRFDGHTLMLSDKSFLNEAIDATRVDDEDVIPFRDKGGSKEEDGIREWTAIRRLGSGKTTLASFDYKNPTAQRAAFDSANAQGDFYPYEIYEDMGSYGFRLPSEGEALAARRMVEHDKDTQYFEAVGNDRSVLPGRTFKLGDHFSAEPRSKEYDPEPRRSIGSRPYLILAVDHEASNNYQAGPGAPSHYENRFTCVRKDIRWRPGRGFNSESGTYTGLHTATVVGPAGAEIHTDGYGRVKVQFHWDRLGKYDEDSSPWIRVMTPAAGHEFGQIRLPRVGEEVAVVYPDGNIDHPLILGALYNALNMPPWKLPEQAALAGLRSRELGGGKRGNHLVLDDTKEQIQAQLRSDAANSQLTLGNITRIEGNQGRTEAQGRGFHLFTDAWGVIRAGLGLLITSEARPGALGHMKGMNETIQRLTLARDRTVSLANLAQQHRAQETGQLDDLTGALRDQNKAIEGPGVAKDAPFPELASPQLVLASPAGINTSTAQSTHIASDEHAVFTTGKDLSLTAGASLFASVRKTLRLFAHHAGMKLVAAAGDIDIHALSNAINILAKLDINITGDTICIGGKQSVEINGGGSYARYTAGGIEQGTSGTFVAKAATHAFPGAGGSAVPQVVLPAVNLASSDSDSFNEQFRLVDEHDNPLPNARYIIRSACGKEWEGISDENGMTQRVYTEKPSSLSLEIDTAQAGSYDQHFVLTNDQTGEPLEHVDYRICLSDGRVYEGVTDKDGKTETVFANSPINAEIEVLL